MLFSNWFCETKNISSSTTQIIYVLQGVKQNNKDPDKTKNYKDHLKKRVYKDPNKKAIYYMGKNIFRPK